jgi:BMFP domain-containing protein YqiC
MAQDSKDNPAQSFSEMVTQWERNFDSFANQVMGTEAYSQAMNNMQKTQLGFQKMFSQAMTQQLAAMNVPSRDDVLHLTEMVAQMNLRLERIEDKLEIPGKSKRQIKRPPRTKKPPVASSKDARDSVSKEKTSKEKVSKDKAPKEKTSKSKEAKK